MDSELNRRLSAIETAITELSRTSWNLVSVKQLAKLLGKSPKTLYNNIEDYPYYKDAKGTIYFRLDEIQEHLCAVKHTPMSQIIASAING